MLQKGQHTFTAQLSLKDNFPSKIVLRLTAQLPMESNTTQLPTGIQDIITPPLSKWHLIMEQYPNYDP